MYQLTEEEKKYINQGGVISEPGTEKQQAYEKFVRENSAGIITSSSLEPISGLNFQTSNPQPAFPVSSIQIPELPKLEPTPQESQADSLSQQIQRLNEQIVGQSALRTQKEQELGIPELQKTQTELSARLKGLQAEALAIPQQLQLESMARGITSGGLRPLETAALRTNAIQALSTSALLEASRGNLLLAQDQVDRAVNQRFQPIFEQIEVKQRNLDLILKSPITTLSEKRRAQEQKNIQERKEIEVKQQQQEQETIWKIALQAAQSGADTLSLRDIQNAPNAIEATRLAAPFLQKPEILTFRNLPDGRAVMIDSQGNIKKVLATSPNIPSGTPVTADGEIIPTITGKPLTDAQSTALG